MASLIGRENVYTCSRCRGYTVTVDVDDGVTPFSIACRASGQEGDCHGRALSAWYPAGPRPDHIPPPAWEWYRPSAAHTRRLGKRNPGLREHIEKGGLVLRRRALAPATGPGGRAGGD